MKILEDQPAELLFQTLKQIRQASQVNTIFEIIVEFAKKLEFDRIIICSISSHIHDEPVDEIFFVYGNWTDRTNIEERDVYLRHCPITKHIFDFDEPFFWSKTIDKKNLKETYRIIKSISEQQGAESGVQVPIFGRTGLDGAISFAGKLTDLGADFKFILQSVCSTAFREIQRIKKLNVNHETFLLTKREKEILKWTAVGRKQSEIAAILRISERTVENHLRAIRLRLGVKSSAEAVARALVRERLSCNSPSLNQSD